MNDHPSLGIPGLCILAGIVITLFGGYKCVKGHIYGVAAEHESTTVGRIVGVSYGRFEAYRYDFSVNELKMDDYSEVCETPLKPGACFNYGPVLVYYSFEPYSNSRLQDFAVASGDSFRIGKVALIIGLPLIVFPSIALVILPRKNKCEDEDGPAEEEPRGEEDGEPDEIHVVPDK